MLITLVTRAFAELNAPTTFCQADTKKLAHGPANHEPMPLRNPHTACHTVWKNFVLVAISTITAIRATMPMMIHVTGDSARAAFHAVWTATTMPIAVASRPRPIASGCTHPEFFCNQPNVASMYGIALARASVRPACTCRLNDSGLAPPDCW